MPSESNPQTVWIGLDVAAKTFVAAVDHLPAPGDDNLEAMPAKQFDRTAQGVEQCLRWAASLVPPATPFKAAMESTGGYSADLFDWLHEAAQGMDVSILNPRMVKDYLKSRSPRRKDDFIDARGIARLATERNPRPTPRPTPLERELRALTRLRTLLVEARDALKDHRAKAACAGLHDKAVDKMVAAHERQIEQLEKRMKRLVESDPRKKADMRRLMEIFGVGELTAIVVIAELFDLRRFASADQLACYCGLTPRTAQSGERKGKGFLSKIGNPHVRRALYMAAVVNVRFRKTDLADWYHRRVEQGMHKMKALVVVMRRLLEKMYLLLTTDIAYQRRPAEGSPP